MSRPLSVNVYVLFLHYFGGSAKTWDAVINALPGRDTIAITQRGWGESARLGGPYGLHQFADDVEAILEQLDLSQVVLVGHSMGGKVAQIVAGRGTATLTGLILVAPAPPVPPQHVTSQYRQQISHAYDNAESIRYARDHVLTYRQLPDDLAAQVLADSAASADDAGRLYWPVQGIAEDISAYAHRIAVPTLVVAGEHDQVEPPHVLVENLLPHIPTATMVTIPDVGHLIPVESPAELAAAIASHPSPAR